MEEKYYIGKRSCRCTPACDRGYMGSSKVLKKEIREIGREHFKKQIVRVFSSAERALLGEIYLHKLVGVSCNDAYYNRANQTSTGFDMTGYKFDEAQRRHFSQLNSGKANYFYGKRFCGKDNPRFGKTLSAETRAKISASKKGKKLGPPSDEARRNMSKAQKGHPGLKGPKNPNYGKRWSEEKRQIMSRQRKGMFAGERHPLYGVGHSEESKIKIAIARCGKYISVEEVHDLHKQGLKPKNIAEKLDCSLSIVYSRLKKIRDVYK